MSTGLVIFARFGSSRLPGKALLPIGNRALLGLMLDRTRRVVGGYPIVIATSDRSEDDPIADFAAAEGVEVFRGSLDDVAKRALDCADAFGFDRFARICGDRPFLDPEMVGHLVDIHFRDDLDLATNILKRTYPMGMASEILSTESLRRVLKETSDPYDREHVTSYFYTHTDRFRIFNQESSSPYDTSISLAVDTRRDLDRAEWIASRLGDEVVTADANKVIALAHEWHADHD